MFGFTNLFGFVGLLLLALAPGAAAEDPAPGPRLPDLELTRIDGRAESLATRRGQVLLIVNVASRCGFTPQYAGLQALQDRFAERGFSVLAFPSNDFAGQEPGSNAEIADFCRATYGVGFPLFAKLHVRGADIHPLYAFLTGLPEPLGGPLAWNFQKYLVDRDGHVVKRYPPALEPSDPALRARIDALLGDASP